MRYVVAMIAAIITTVLAMKFLSGPVSNWIALQMHYESSDSAETVNQMAFMATNLFGLIVGWTIGWAMGAPLSRDKDDDV
ncbi:MAG: hypothetical protein K0U34_03350 [Alphaproteobacteria bacterium]|nr:hypothetical protein [Alphaproteobacteria bacterium]